MAETTNERRVAKRRETDSVIRFEGDNFAIYSRMTNRSDTGAFLATHYLLDPLTQIQIHFLDSGESPSARGAEVVRMVGETGVHGELNVGIGVKFSK